MKRFQGAPSARTVEEGVLIATVVDQELPIAQEPEVYNVMEGENIPVGSSATKASGTVPSRETTRRGRLMVQESSCCQRERRVAVIIPTIEQMDGGKLRIWRQGREVNITEAEHDATSLHD